jgi:hypothetical protein
MGFGRLVTRRKGVSVVPVVVLGAAVSLGVVALTASRFGWRRTTAEPDVEGQPAPPAAAPEAEAQPAPPALRFKPAPPRAADAPRWDTPPAALNGARPDPPSP